MEEVAVSSSLTNPNPKPKVVVIMGATGSGKSRLAIDLASYFPIEIINADSMQVYQGLDVLTNKVPLADRNGVPHHLLGTISANVDFTSKDFRDLAIPIIDDILSRKCLPVVVGGTNYYIQALVSSFLVDDLEDLDECFVNEPLGDMRPKFSCDRNDVHVSFDILKEVDPAAANRIHPNDLRKIQRYLALYASLGVLPSTLFQQKGSEKRRLKRLESLFGWNLHYVDATDALLCNSGDSWLKLVVEPCVNIIKSLLCEDASSVIQVEKFSSTESQALVSRDLWTQYICEACGNRTLRGAHEWEQHIQGRGHRKRISRLKKKSQASCVLDQYQHP